MAFLHTEHLSKACKEKSCKLNGGSAQNKSLKGEIIEEINVKGGGVAHINLNFMNIISSSIGGISDAARAELGNRELIKEG